MFPGISLLKLFAVMEADLDLNRFSPGDVHLWPIARSCFGAKKVDNNIAPEQRTGEFKQIDRAIESHYERLLASSPPRPDRPVASFTAGRAPTSGDGVLVFTRPEDHHLQTPRGHYAPVLDPWVEVASSGWRCQKVEIAGDRFAATQPRVHPTEPIHMPGVGNERVEDLNDLRRMARVLAMTVTKWLEQEIGFSYPNFVSDLDAYLAALWVEKEQLASMLAARNPRLVLTNCTYLRPTLSVTWAARERGIAVADVQHGGNGPFHMGYTHWRAVPPSGYQAMPDLFFTWDAISANNIARWLPEDAGSRVIVTGRFDLESTRRAYMGDATGSPLDLAARDSAKTILVTLQPLPSTGLTPMLLEAMKRAPPDWTWLVRSHPMAVAWKRTDMMPEHIEATLRANGIGRAESRFSTALPLAVVLPLVDHHVTGFSGTVQECAAYGIATTFTHGAAHFSFPSYIEAGIAGFANSADDILTSIARPAPRQNKMTDMPRDPGDARRVLQQLLG